MIINIIDPVFDVNKQDDFIIVEMAIDINMLFQLSGIKHGVVKNNPSEPDGEFYFIKPTYVDKSVIGNYGADEIELIAKDTSYDPKDIQWLSSIFLATHYFNNLMSLGVSPGDANSVMPVCSSIDIIYIAEAGDWNKIFTHIKESKCISAHFKSVMLDVEKKVRFYIGKDETE